MADDKKQPETSQPKPVQIEIEMPDRVTGYVWDVYANGRRDYIAKNQDNNTGRIADYYGAVALIKAGIVKLTAPGHMLAWLDQDYRTLDAEWIGLLQQEVALPVEMAFNRPTTWQVVSRKR